MKPKVYFMSLRKDTNPRSFWDYALLEDLLADFEKVECHGLPNDEMAIVVIPAKSHADLVPMINLQLKQVKNVLLFLMGDEEHLFPVELIKHPNAIIWVQYPKMGRHDKYHKLPIGYTPGIHKYKEKPTVPATLPGTFDCVFAGQVTHSRREAVAAEFEKKKDDPRWEIEASKGFSQGLPQQGYYNLLAHSKTAACPSGPAIVDSFRLYEAIELGAVPIADSKTPNLDEAGYWEWLFGEPVPFPVVSEWEQLIGYSGDAAAKYPKFNNEIVAWWQRMKLKLKARIQFDIEDLGGTFEKKDVTVIIPISPIPSHPKIDMLMQTIKSIRMQFPNSLIMPCFDGVRPEQESMAPEYQEAIRRALWEFSEIPNIYPIIFSRHMHQSGMTRIVIDYVRTDLVLFVEQDTPFVTDLPIDIEKCKRFILSGESNLIRFHFEAIIPEPHKWLMIGEPENGFLKTYQWSQRPHLASTAFYRRVMSENFTNMSRCFIEDKMHGKVIGDVKKYGLQGWNQWRLHIYFPDEKNIKRSLHLDGRAGGNQFADKQIW